MEITLLIMEIMEKYMELCGSLALINIHVDIYSKARGLNFGLSHPLHPYFVLAYVFPKF